MAVADTNVVISDVGRKYLQLQLTDEIGPIRLRRLREHFGSLDAVLSASVAELQRVDGIGPKVARAIVQSRDPVTAEEEIERARASSVRILCLEDDDYPKPLRNIPDPPICLYVRGQLLATDAVAVAIVGTRGCSHYGKEQALRFGEALAGAGFTVVSGLARGIDGHAHRGALRGGGRTLAVLGNGLPSIYPPEHAELAEEIARSGAVLSELPIGTQPTGENFPRRNRIIVGLSLGVIVVEAGVASGALITARLASDYNREVFALPGRVDQPRLTAGTNSLIRDGQAKLITCLQDVLDELGPVGQVMARGTGDKPEGDGRADTASAMPALPPEQSAVFSVVVQGAEDTDRIAEETGLEIARVTSILTSLELKGLVVQCPGPRFVPSSRKPQRMG